MPLATSTFTSLSPHVMRQQWLKLFGLHRKKKFFKFLERSNIINCRTTEESLHVGVHVALIAKDKYTSYVQFNHLINSQISGLSNNRGVIFNNDETSTFLHIISCS